MKAKSLLIGVCLLIISCSTHDFKVFEGSGNCPVMLEVRRFEGFDLKFINLGKDNIGGLVLTFDKHHEHTLKGLYSVERGLLKDSVFRSSDTLTLQFSDNISNLLYFKIEDDSYVPEEVALHNKDCSTTWLIK